MAQVTSVGENQFLRAAGRGADRRGPWRESDERRSGQPKLSEKQLNAKKNNTTPT